MEAIRDTIARKVLEPPGLDVGEFVEPIVQRYGDDLVGVFMYGSMLSQVTASEDSFPDFFVITNGYGGDVFHHLSHRLTAYPLPPHLYHLQLGDGRHAKYNLVSVRRFQQETSAWAMDIYILGRFGKRTALLWARDETARQTLTGCCVNAMTHVAVWTLRGMQAPFDATEFTLACLNISYAGETRVEATSKVPRLYKAEQAFYDAVYPALLEASPDCRQLAEPIGDGRYRPCGSAQEIRLRRMAFEWFIRSSRIRGVLRWPKFLLTVEDWVDIILAKIERAKGIKLDPGPLTRRYPLVLGWPYLLKVIRAGALGSFRSAPDKTAVSG